MQLTIVSIPGHYSILRLDSVPDVAALSGFYTLSRTADEVSLICRTDCADALAANARDDGYGLLRIAGQLDFSLIGILARLTAALAQAGIPVCAVSTFDTDYLLIKQARMDEALAALRGCGCAVEG